MAFKIASRLTRRAALTSRSLGRVLCTCYDTLVKKTVYSHRSRGGKSAAPTIQVDEDWKKVCEDLARQPFSRVVDLSVTLDSGCLSPRFEKIQVVNHFQMLIPIPYAY